MNITLGQIAFEAYGREVGGKTYDDKPIPHWDEVKPTVKAGWEAAAKAVSGLGGAHIGGSLKVGGDFVGRDSYSRGSK